MWFLSPGWTLIDLAFPYRILDMVSLCCWLLGFVIFLQIVSVWVWHTVKFLGISRSFRGLLLSSIRVGPELSSVCR